MHIVSLSNVITESKVLNNFIPRYSVFWTLFSASAHSDINDYSVIGYGI